MTQAMPAFGPAKYKDTTRTQGQAAAQAWNEWGSFLRRWLGPASGTMLDLCGGGVS